MEDQETVAEAKRAIEREQKLNAKLNEQTAINQNLQVPPPLSPFSFVFFCHFPYSLSNVFL